MFSLRPLPLQSEDLGILPAMMPIEPRFALPSLDEYVSSPDRLLAGMADRLGLRREPDTGSLEKGKHKEVVEEVAGEKEVDRAVDDSDLWLRAGDLEPGPSRPRRTKLDTWDKLDDPAQTATESEFLSEASVFAFDAIIETHSLHIALPKLRSRRENPPKSLEETLRLLMRATLGNTTTGGIKWRAKDYRFEWSASDGRVTGIEGTSTQWAASGFLDVATCLKRLEMTVDSLTPRPMTPTHHAFLHALSTYLTYIKQRLTSSIEECSTSDNRAWHRWCLALRDVRELLGVLCEIIQWPLEQARPTPLPSRSSSLLTHLHAHLLAHLSTASPDQARGPVVISLAYLLKSSSQPLVLLLHQWVGLADRALADEGFDHDAQPWADLGITRHAAPAVRYAEPRWEYTFSANKMPGFIPKADRRTLFEAGKSLRLLQEASNGQHPLCAQGWGIQGTWGWGEDSDEHDHLRLHTRRVGKEIDRRSRSSRGLTQSISSSSSLPRLRTARKSRKALPHDFISPRPPHTATMQPTLPIDTTSYAEPDNKPFDPIWSVVNQAPGSHFGAAQRNSLWSPTPLSELEAFMARHSEAEYPLLPEHAPTLSQHISSHLLAPLLTHSSLISTSLVSLYLDNLGFLDHLDILNAYWLGGDISFLERVNGALFGKDSAGAGEALGMGKRARTRARLGLGQDQDQDQDRGNDGERAEEHREWGIGLGIGLSERTKWPPGGAELTYALRTAIVDDERPLAPPHSDVWEGIEDKVSYAIQDLPEDRRDGRRAKWLDPQAIEALDFLYLAYSPPPTIAVLLPRPIMEKYQSIHNLLLRLGRVETVLRSMFIDTHHQHDIVEEPLKTGIDAHYNRPSSRSKSRIERLRSGIFPPGSREEKRLWALRYRMSHFITNLTRYILNIAIGANWRVLRKRLARLRKQSFNSPSSRADTPTPSGEEDEYFGFDDLDLLNAEQADEEEDGSASTENLSQLHSIHSIVTYHNAILDRILRSCLLSPSAGYQVTYKILTTLFGIVLDFAKTAKEVEKGLVGWQDGAEQIDQYWLEWVEKETVFLHAVERLSARTGSEKPVKEGEAADHDMEMLLHGDDGYEGGSSRIGRQGADLQELVLRIRLATR